MTTRRNSLKTLGALSLSSSIERLSQADEKTFCPRVKQIPELSGKLGIVTASLSSHITTRPVQGKFTLLELPRILKDELDLEIVDFNTMNFPSFDPAYLEKLRDSVTAAGCIATNLKMNQRVYMNSAHPEERAEAMRIYRKSIDAAATLGLKWVRPLPRSATPDRSRNITAYSELIDYAGERGITLLIENFGWMMKHPDSAIKLADEIGRDQIALGPDTGNWSDNEVRYSGLENLFPRAVTCDFKAKILGPRGEHRAYDLRKCFNIGWDAGFRGPWNFEHAHEDRKRVFRELGMLRDWLRDWMKEKGGVAA